MLLLSRPVMSDSLRPPALQHARPPCPSHLLKFIQVHVHCIGYAIQPSHPLMPSSPSVLSLSSIRDFSNESSDCIRRPKYRSLSFVSFVSFGAWTQHQSFQEYSGLISLKIDWFDLLVVQGLSGENPDWPDDRMQFTLIHGPNIPGSYAILFFAASDFTFITRHVHNWSSFPLWASRFILSGAVSSSPLFFPSSVLDTFWQLWGTHLSVSYVFVLSYNSWGSHGKYTGVVCHSPLQWIMFCQNSPLCPVHLGWPCTAWLIALLSYASLFTMTRQWLWRELAIPQPVQSLSRLRLFLTPWTAAHQASLSITNSRSSPKLMSIESMMPSSHLILCRPFLLLPPIPPSIRVFSNESALCIRWQSIGVSASTSVLPMNIQDWFPLGWMGWIFLQSKGLSVQNKKLKILF